MEVEKDVKAEPSTAAEQVVNQDVASPDQATENQQQDIQLDSQEPTQAVNPEVPEVDEMGVPWKNRAMEYRRKFEEVSTKQEEILNKLNGLQTGTQKTYSEAELRMFADSTENPYHKQWAVSEIEKLREQKNASIVRSEIERWKQEEQAKQVKQQTFGEVMQAYPEAFLKDASGNFLGWNPQSPLTQRIAAYMEHPTLRSDPMGLKAAAAMAAQDLARSQKQQSQAKELKMKREIKTLQSKTLTEGSGTQVDAPTSPTRKAVDKTVSGNLADAKEAMKEIFRATGAIKD